MAQQFTPAEVVQILRALDEAGGVLIGGQAINLWSTLLEKNEAPWDESHPFSSYDVDALCDAAELMRLAKKLRAAGYDVVVRAAETAAEKRINTGIIFARPHGGGEEIPINLLSTPLGISSAEIRALRATVTFCGQSIAILHPILCVESKAFNLCSLPQDDPGAERQDRKHLILALANCREYLAGHCAPATALRWAHRVADLALHRLGMDVFQHHALDVLDAIPWPAWARAADGALAAFGNRQAEFAAERAQRFAQEVELAEWFAKLKTR